MPIRAVIFCQVNHNSMKEVIEELRDIPEIKRVLSLTGDYDILAEIEVNTSEELYQAFAERIDPIEGILRTNTHMIMKSFEK
ncbi:MAG: hypothetical protein GF383_04880 [Candidatus Lokiarchaeota archaeon]|nr:hypothetical protein [Candidatus Lokiarchaeota archaeon]MBD3339156.1 hypothetical protein [Candidatus Lokiarchaeota archaeon]